MANFKYEAKNRAGKTVKGKIEAPGPDSAGQKLRSQGLTDISVTAAGPGFSLAFLSGGITVKDMKIFTQQFSTMIDAGLPLVQCLDILGSQNDNKMFAAVLLDVKATVEGGATFSEALAKHPKVFDELFVNLVAAGEMGGILDTIMKRLGEYIEKRERLQKQIKGAMTYPVTILVITLALVTVMLKWVIPTFSSMFVDMGGEMPALTQAVMDLSESFQENWWIMALAIGALVAMVSVTYSNPKGKYIYHKVFLVLPIFGPLIRKIAVARFCRTMGTLLSSGVPILDAMDTVAKAAGNMIIAEFIGVVKTQISEGRNMSEPLSESDIFPGMVVQMIAVGEQTGALDVMCVKIADFYDEEVDVAVSALTSMLEPVMMIFIGGMVGTMLIAMYLPIFSMAGGASN